jgi:hypothetical protein
VPQPRLREARVSELPVEITVTRKVWALSLYTAFAFGLATGGAVVMLSVVLGWYR